MERKNNEAPVLVRQKAHRYRNFFYAQLYENLERLFIKSSEGNVPMFRILSIDFARI